jgi:hypothetical protein
MLALCWVASTPSKLRKKFKPPNPTIPLAKKMNLQTYVYNLILLNIENNDLFLPFPLFF